MAIDFRVRDFFHPGSILRLHRQFARNQWKPAEEIESDQLDRLRRILSRAGREIPYYRRLFAEIDFEPARLGSISELGMIPLLD